MKYMMSDPLADKVELKFLTMVAEVLQAITQINQPFCSNTKKMCGHKFHTCYDKKFVKINRIYFIGFLFFVFVR